MSDILLEILENKKKEVAAAKKIISEEDYLNKIKSTSTPGASFVKLIQESQNKFGIIAEIKKKSPSKGILRENYFPEKVAVEYEANGASAISVLTDEKYFGGSIKDLIKVRDVTSLPILRKDFIVDSYQIIESKAIGANIILLIASALSHDEIKVFYEKALGLGLEVLIEIHTSDEIEKIEGLDKAIIGINNRNLRTFEVDLNTTFDLRPQITNQFVISESGIASGADLNALREKGVSGALIGESLMKSDSPGDKLRSLLKEAVLS